MMTGHQLHSELFYPIREGVLEDGHLNIYPTDQLKALNEAALDSARRTYENIIARAEFLKTQLAEARKKQFIDSQSEPEVVDESDWPEPTLSEQLAVETSCLEHDWKIAVYDKQACRKILTILDNAVGLSNDIDNYDEDKPLKKLALADCRIALEYLTANPEITEITDVGEFMQSEAAIPLYEREGMKPPVRDRNSAVRNLRRASLGLYKDPAFVEATTADTWRNVLGFMQEIERI